LASKLLGNFPENQLTSAHICQIIGPAITGSARPVPTPVRHYTQGGHFQDHMKFPDFSIGLDR